MFDVDCDAVLASCSLSMLSMVCSMNSQAKAMYSKFEYADVLSFSYLIHFMLANMRGSTTYLGIPSKLNEVATIKNSSWGNRSKSGIYSIHVLHMIRGRV